MTHVFWFVIFFTVRGIKSVLSVFSQPGNLTPLGGLVDRTPASRNLCKRGSPN